MWTVRSRVPLLFPTFLFAASVSAAGSPMLLVCKGRSQFTCIAAGCQAQGSATENELAIGARAATVKLCYGSACWTTDFVRHGALGKNQVSISYGGTAVLNGHRERVQATAVIDTATFAYQLAIPGGSGSIDVFFGNCTCQGAGAAEHACATTLQR